MNKFVMAGLLLMIVASFCSCRRTEEVIDYYPNGQVKQIYHVSNKDGRMVGHSISYYETGTVYSEGKTNNKGVMVGKWVTYYPDGKTRTVEKHNRRGKLKTFDSWDQEGNHVIVNGTGTLVTYYPDGSIEQTVTFKDCRFEGANEGWYPNGQKEHELFYKDGKPIGVWRFWNENGELVLTESYEE